MIIRPNCLQPCSTRSLSVSFREHPASWILYASCIGRLASGGDWREDARNWRHSQTASRRRAEETKLKKFRTSKKAGHRSSDEAPGFAVSEATARHIHGPCCA